MPFAPVRRAGSPLRVVVRLALAVIAISGAATAWAYVERAVTLHMRLPDGRPIAGPCTIAFVGSSTIHKWESLAADMAPWSVRNRGVNGALLDEIGARLALDPPGRPPAAVLFYAGENDIAMGATPQQTARGLLALVDRERRRMPTTPMFVVALKPSPTRWYMRGDQLTASALLARDAARHGAQFLSVGDDLLLDGRPGPFYQGDGIHLDRTGYRLWSRAVRRGVEAALPPAVLQRCLRSAGAGA